MSESLPYDETKIHEKVKWEDLINIPVDPEIGYFTEVDLKNPDYIKEKTGKFHFTLRIKLIFTICLVNIWTRYNRKITYKIKVNMWWDW